MFTPSFSPSKSAARSVRKTRRSRVSLSTVRRAFGTLGIVALSALCVRSAGGQTIPTSGRGQINNLGVANANTPTGNYAAGDVANHEYRNHFDFSIPTLSQPLTGATLAIFDPNHSGGTNTYSLSSLGAYGTYTFSDIGTGTAYGSASLDSADAGTTVDITLNAAALADITAAQGGTFHLGGVIGDVDNNYDFTGSLNDPVDLILTEDVTASTPEPGVNALLAGLSLVGTGVFARRRARRK